MGSMIDGMVSVVVPFHEVEPAFFREAIESVRAQTYGKWELLLASDAADGECLAVAQEHAAAAPERIRVLAHPGGAHRGHSATRNLGISNARGEFIAFLDADDVFLPQKLADQVALLGAYPQAAMTYGLTEYWHSWSGPATVRQDFVPELGLRAPAIVEPPDLLPMFLDGTAAVPCTCSVVARSVSVRAVGGFEDAFRALYGDQAFYAKMCLSTRILVTDGLWDRYRQHSSSLTGRTRASRELEHRRVFLTWLEGLLEREHVREAALWRSLRRELWKLRHPRVARVLRTGRRFSRRVTRMLAPRPVLAC
jgi:glycosyltransferase involved in cell wall biosynthesis